MPDFPALSTRAKPYENGLGSVTTRPFLPTLKPEDPKLTTYNQARRFEYSLGYAPAR